MAEIDLVPQEYRYWRWQLRCLKSAGIAVIAVALLAALSWYGLHQHQLATQSALHALQTQKNISQAQQQRLEYLSTSRSSLEQQWKLLLGLRGGATVEGLFEVLDQALEGERVWFKEWRFLRAGQTVEHKQIQPQRDRGAYIIVLPPESSETPEEPPAWSIATRLAIEGGADDHAALSDFVERLLSQPRISDVKVLNTSLYASGPDSAAINFSLSVLVNNALDMEV